ncbi:hypothetical protein VOLCADRAFT_121614 [Volvox carteri f. nagariensis]|uniref:Uncharacterized protein n=1 Tax=Volvox carteri f. nagariensis TaxID=3068 RepID=D8UEU7_VOLCA|nr:uncharacterized protein VOLCADRAFT_121614 [Volvox carteri f. nagariensis]EFJ41702.1 hypothetical protein VOLCADRAFT_121614 [Volvox carteri f. nagariensis]|eukprot:XP_002957204.1 hypothetical protein VOLCADRAFT_121614 [Volvox carteri f. nagariensis]
MALMNELIVTRQLFAHAGAFDGASASPILKTLFSIVTYGENPHSASQQLVRYYNAADVAGHGGGGRKRSAIHEEPSPQGGSAGGKGSDGDGRGGWGFARLPNLQGLLRLLADLSRLQLGGRVDAGFRSQGEAPCKGLITALLRMLLDMGLSSRLHTDVCAALEGLMQPWDEPRWRRICDDTAVTAADLGPSHRAAYRVISGVHGLSERLRTWQQCAMLQLLRKTLPPEMTCNSGGPAGSHRGQLHVDIRQVQTMLGKDCAKGVKALLNGLRRSLRDRGSAGAAGGGVDYWLLLTVLQCAHMVTWTSVYVEEGEEVDKVIRWILTYFKSVEQSLRGQQATVMRIKVFLADVQTNYELLARVD